MKQTDVHNWLYSEIVSVLSTTSLLSLSTPDTHVDLADERDSKVYPFVGIQPIGNATRRAGIGSQDLFVDDVTYSNGVVDSIVYRRENTHRVDVIPVTDDDPGLRSDLADELVDHFTLRARSGGLHADMESLTVDEASPQGRTDEFVRSQGIPIEIEYNRYVTESDPVAAETVNVDINVTDDPDAQTSTDAFDETL